MSHKGYDLRYKHWLEQVDRWADKHSITTEQAISVIFRDQSGVNYKDLHWNEAPEFAEKYFDEL